jgi:hypothetical protein
MIIILHDFRMAIEQIEYIIHKDGRVEEKVTGVKGAEVVCSHSGGHLLV